MKYKIIVQAPGMYKYALVVAAIAQRARKKVVLNAVAGQPGGAGVDLTVARPDGTSISKFVKVAVWSICALPDSATDPSYSPPPPPDDLEVGAPVLACPANITETHPVDVYGSGVIDYDGYQAISASYRGVSFTTVPWLAGGFALPAGAAFNDSMYIRCGIPYTHGQIFAYDANGEHLWTPSASALDAAVELCNSGEYPADANAAFEAARLTAVELAARNASRLNAHTAAMVAYHASWAARRKDELTQSILNGSFDFSLIPGFSRQLAMIWADSEPQGWKDLKGEEEGILGVRFTWGAGTQALYVDYLAQADGSWVVKKPDDYLIRSSSGTLVVKILQTTTPVPVLKASWIWHRAVARTRAEAGSEGGAVFNAAELLDLRAAYEVLSAYYALGSEVDEDEDEEIGEGWYYGSSIFAVYCGFLIGSDNPASSFLRSVMWELPTSAVYTSYVARIYEQSIADAFRMALVNGPMNAGMHEVWLNNTGRTHYNAVFSTTRVRLLQASSGAQIEDGVQSVYIVYAMSQSRAQLSGGEGALLTVTRFNDDPEDPGDPVALPISWITDSYAANGAWNITVETVPLLELPTYAAPALRLRKAVTLSGGPLNFEGYLNAGNYAYIDTFSGAPTLHSWARSDIYNAHWWGEASGDGAYTKPVLLTTGMVYGSPVVACAAYEAPPPPMSYKWRYQSRQLVVRSVDGTYNASVDVSADVVNDAGVGVFSLCSWAGKVTNAFLSSSTMMSAKLAGERSYMEQFRSN